MKFDKIKSLTKKERKRLACITWQMRSSLSNASQVINDVADNLEEDSSSYTTDEIVEELTKAIQNFEELEELIEIIDLMIDNED